MSYTIRIRQADEPITVETGDTILETALAQGVPYPHGCRSGNCGACKTRLLDGDVMLSPYSDFALSAQEHADGLILACRAVPWSDCTVAWLEQDDVVMHPQRKLDCRVGEILDATHDIKIVRLEIVAGGPFDFSAGQYAHVKFDGQPGRDYSMASRPDDAMLEFHIRQVTGGRASVHVATALAVGDAVTVEGPLGNCHLREDHRGPIIALAGGSGLAPIKSIIETALAKELPQPIYLYFGARDERDVYLEDHLKVLAAAHARFKFTVVLSEPAGPTQRRTGLVTDAVKADYSDLDGCKAYLAGPPPMVEAGVDMLELLDMRHEDIHADAFYTEAEKAALEPPA